MFWIFILNTFWFIGCNLVVLILFGLVCLALASRKLVNTTELARDRSVTMITCGASLDSVETTDKKFFTGNQLLRFTIRLLTLCEQFGIPYALENPYSSYAWHMPPLARFIRKFQPYVVHLDFCQFGECWKKPTTVMGNFWNVPSIARRCSGTFGKCSATSAPHVPLTGLASNGLFRTLLAQPYPQALAHLVAANVAKTITS